MRLSQAGVLCVVVCVLVPIYANVVNCSRDSDVEHFQDFKIQYGKAYRSAAEEERRFQIFKENLVRAAELSAKNPLATFGVTKFSDLDPLEFQQQYLGYRPGTKIGHPVEHTPMARSVKRHAPKASPNVTVDWRTSGAVSPVKDQGQCGACWAFSAVESVESAWFLAHGTLPILSPQQVTSCDSVDHGCDGGWPHSAFAYIKSAGLTTEAQYPYTSGTSGDSGKCQTVASVSASISGFSYATAPCNDSCTTQDEATLFANLASTGPASVCVDAAPWQTYTGGILGGGCSQDYNDLDHAVQLVGYNIKNQIPYWIVRNSWGSSWGERGYVYLEYGKNLCGIADEATFAISA